MVKINFYMSITGCYSLSIFCENVVLDILAVQTVPLALLKIPITNAQGTCVEGEGDIELDCWKE